MEHVAIMRKSWGMTQKILSGKKKIESRWYNVKYAPWNKIKVGEIIYFKDSGEPVTVKAEVENVIQFSDLIPEKVNEILFNYGHEGGICINSIPNFFDIVRNKKYCILVFLKNPEKVEPFSLDKTGFGAMSAWISVDSVNFLKIKI